MEYSDRQARGEEISGEEIQQVLIIIMCKFIYAGNIILLLQAYASTTNLIFPL